MERPEDADGLAAHLKVVFDLSPDLLGIADANGVFRVVNAAWRTMGYDPVELTGVRYQDLIHPDDRHLLAEPSPARDAVEVRLRRKDGDHAWFAWSTARSPEGGGVITMGRDRTLRKALEAKMRQTELQMKELVDNADDAICTTDLEGRFTSINRAAERLSGYSSDEAIGRSLTDFLAPEYRSLPGQMRDLKLSGRPFTVYEVDLVTKSGERVPIELNTRLQYVDGKAVGIQGIARDIRVRKRLADELQQRNEELEEANRTILSLMNQDALTKLPNRRFLEEVLAKAVSFAHRTGQPLSLVVCDVDRFKQINDNFGHAAGDELLSAFGSLLAVSCRKEDTAARYGGEEFVLVLPNTRLNAAIEFVERIRSRTESLAVPSGASITASFGVVECSPEDTADTLVARADALLYRAKQEGRNRVLAG